MRLLFLGGTVFLGRALTDAALARRHSVTHVHRGVSAGCDDRVETLIADRTSAQFLSRAEPARSWDAVVDTSGYLPQVVRLSVDALRHRVGRYAFVSSISAYRSFDSPPTAEDAALQSAPDPLPDAMTPELYGALKAGCETVVAEAFDDRALIVRPGLIVGPHDPTDRFTWWPWRIAQGGPFVAPGRPDRPVQFIDVRDLAEWIVAMLERGVGGTFNVTGPRAKLAMSDVVGACQAAGPDSESAPLWLSEEFLLRHGVKPWIEMPLWIPHSNPMRGLMDVDTGRASSRGLSLRPLSRTVEDTLAWARSRRPDHRWKAGLEREREEALLAAWRKDPM